MSKVEFILIPQDRPAPCLPWLRQKKTSGPGAHCRGQEWPQLPLFLCRQHPIPSILLEWLTALLTSVSPLFPQTLPSRIFLSSPRDSRWPSLLFFYLVLFPFPSLLFLHIVSHQDGPQSKCNCCFSAQSSSPLYLQFRMNFKSGPFAVKETCVWTLVLPFVWFVRLLNLFKPAPPQWSQNTNTYLRGSSWGLQEILVIKCWAQ